MTTTRFRQATLSLFAALAFAITAIIAVAPMAHADADSTIAPSGTGCPSGAVCIYPDDSWNGGNPTYVFWSYGAHQIYNQYGEHRVYNNQTGGAGVTLCQHSDGDECGYIVPAGEYSDYKLDRVNSFLLFP